MNILLCTSEVGENAGGLAFHCKQLKETFETLGHRVFVEVLLNPKEYCSIDGGYDINLGKKIRISKKIQNINKKYGNIIDLCVSCGGGQTAYYSMLICKSNEIPLNIVLCGSETNIAFGNVDLSFYNTEAFRYASAIVGLSNELINNAKLVNTNINCKYYVLPIYRDMLANKNMIENVSKERLSFISGSSYLGEKKGISNLLYAFSTFLKDFNRDDVLYLVGKVDEDIKQQYLRIIESNSLENNVYLLGYMPREKFITKIQESDVYIQASPFEGFGMSVIEALDVGTDILITNTGYIAEKIAEIYPGHIIYHDTPCEIAKEINNYICNIFEKKDSARIRDLLQMDLSSKKVMSQWESILNNTDKCRVRIYPENCLSVMFHDVDSMFSGIDYAVEGFENLMSKLHNRGYRVCSSKEYFMATDKSNLIICTFDDGYENVYKNAYPIMSKFGFTATVFVCPDLIGKNNDWNHRDDVNRKHMNDEMIGILAENGWEIGSHGLSHINMIRLSEHELDKCLGQSKELLKKYGEIEAFCYPYGIFNLYIKNKTKSYYSRAFSVDMGGSDCSRDLYQITRLTPEELIRKLNLL